jgi:hypothetical protein
MAITRLIDLIPCPTKDGAYEAPAFLVLINHKNIRHVLSSTTFSSSMVPGVDEDSKYSGDAATGTGKAASTKMGWVKGVQETGDNLTHRRSLTWLFRMDSICGEGSRVQHYKL